MPEEPAYIHPRLDPWPRVELDEGQVLSPLLYMHALGCVITEWNRLEAHFRYLIAEVTGLPIAAMRPLLTHVALPTLANALNTMVSHRIDNATNEQADYFEEALKASELAAKAFSICQLNRNFLVHNAEPMNFTDALRENPGLQLLAVTARKTVDLKEKGGNRKRVKIERFAVTLEDIRRVADECRDVGQYCYYLGPKVRLRKPGEIPLELPPAPRMPVKLQKSLRAISGFNDITHKGGARVVYEDELRAKMKVERT